MAVKRSRAVDHRWQEWAGKAMLWRREDLLNSVKRGRFPSREGGEQHEMSSKEMAMRPVRGQVKGTSGSEQERMKPDMETEKPERPV